MANNDIKINGLFSVCRYIIVVLGVVLLSAWTPKSASAVNLPKQDLQQDVFKEITGIVKTQEGDPIPGVVVNLRGTNIGTETDIEGKYSLNANEGDKIKFVYEGFKTTTVTVNQSNILNITMIEDEDVLSDIMVDGYRTTSKETIGCAGVFYKPKTIEEYVKEQNIASISAVTSEMLGCRFGYKDVLSTLKEAYLKTMISNKFIDQAVGLEITTGNNIPKEQTILKDVENLTRNGNYVYIVDGVRVSEETFRSLNQNDVESIDVYKHSDITQALYGNKDNQSRIALESK